MRDYKKKSRDNTSEQKYIVEYRVKIIESIKNGGLYCM